MNDYVGIKRRNNNSVRRAPSAKLSKKLLPDERRMFAEIGEVDYSQNWLEMLSNKTMRTLFDIVNSGLGNQKKAEHIRKELKPLGFKDLGLGTNVFAMKHPAYSGVAYKLALDSNGIADNFNDPILMWGVNDYLVRNKEKPRYNRVLANDKSGLVSVQERQIVVRSQDRIGQFRKSIFRTLELLARKYLIIDLTPTEYHLNYGITRSGDWCFIDASDLYPLDSLDDELRCANPVGYNAVKGRMERCGGAFKYNDDFSRVICKRCGHEYLPIELRPKQDERRKKVMKQFSDGLSPEEIAARQAQEEACVKPNVASSGRKTVRTVTSARTTTKLRPDGGRLRFRRPVKDPEPAPVLQAPDNPEEDEDEEIVERKSVSEPDTVTLETVTTTFREEIVEPANKTVNAYGELDDDEEDEDEEDTEADEPEDSESNQPNVVEGEYNIDYIVDESAADPDEWNICVNVSGDVKAAADAFHSIYVSFDGGKTQTMLFPSSEVGRRVMAVWSEE